MPFTNHDHMKSSIVQGDYIGYDNWEQKSRNFGIRLSWRFGKLKASVKKADKTIQNNDVVGGIGKWHTEVRERSDNHSRSVFYGYCEALFFLVEWLKTPNVFLPA